MGSQLGVVDILSIRIIETKRRIQCLLSVRAAGANFVRSFRKRKTYRDGKLRRKVVKTQLQNEAKKVLAKRWGVRS